MAPDVVYGPSGPFTVPWSPPCSHPWFRRAPFAGLPIVWRCFECGGLKLGPGYERAA